MRQSYLFVPGSGIIFSNIATRSPPTVPDKLSDPNLIITPLFSRVNTWKQLHHKEQLAEIWKNVVFYLAITCASLASQRNNFQTLFFMKQPWPFLLQHPGWKGGGFSCHEEWTWGMLQFSVSILCLQFMSSWYLLNANCGLYIHITRFR